MALKDDIICLDVHLSNCNDRLRHAWERVSAALEQQDVGISTDKHLDKIAFCINRIDSLRSQLCDKITDAQYDDFNAVVAQLRQM